MEGGVGMRRRQLILLLGIIGLGLVGCQKQPSESVIIMSSEEIQESSLEETLESVSELETELEVEPSVETTSIEATSMETASEETVESVSKSNTVAGKSFLTQMADGKLYYFDDEGNLAPNGVSPDGKNLGADGEYIFEDLGLAEVTNKSQIDEAISDNYNIYEDGSMGFEFNDYYSSDNVWIDCGDYYRVDNVSLVIWIEQGDVDGLGATTLKELDSIYIRKDGVYMYNGEYYTLEEWIERFGYAPRWGVMFDEKGYIVSWRDFTVC